MSALSRRARRLLGIPAGAVVGVVAALAAGTQLGGRFEADTLDARFHLRGERALDSRVVVVDVNDETLSLLGWPVPRGFYAQLIDTVTKHGARAVGFDVLFLEKSSTPGMDALLAKTAASCKCAVFPSQLTPLDAGAWKIESPIEELASASASVAHVQLDNSVDGVFRTVPPRIEVPASNGGANGAQNAASVPGSSAGANGAPIATAVPGSSAGANGAPSAASVPGSSGAANGAPSATSVATSGVYPALAIAVAHVAGAPVHVRDLDPPAAKFDPAWIEWRAASSGSIHALPMLDVLGAQQSLDAGEKPSIDLDATFRGALVLVGQSAKSVGDRGPVPFSSDAPLVLAHANFLDNILADRLLEPPSFASILVLSMLIAMFVGGAATWLRAVGGLATFVGALAVLWLIAVASFNGANAWIPLAAPSIAAGVSFFVATVTNVAVRDADEKRLRQAFERYVAPQVLDKILEKPDDIDIRGHTRTLTLLFSDIKGYTTLSNTLPPDSIVELLCTYLDTMVDILLQHEGTVDKIMGDGIMAFFGDPITSNDHAIKCVKAALDMQRATAELGEKWVQRGLLPLQVRIGVATGEVFVGSIGSRNHLEYTAIGRPVNLASRLEGKAPPGGVLVSSETYALIKDAVVAREVKGLDLKGYAGGYDAWLVTGLVGEEQADVGDVENRRNARRPFFSEVVLTHGTAESTARSTDISPGGMFVHGDALPPEGARVKVRANLTRAQTSPVQMDAVVTHVRDGGAGLMFTSVYADDRLAIQALLEGVLGHEGWNDERIVDEGGGKLSYTIASTSKS